MWKRAASWLKWIAKKMHPRFCKKQKVPLKWVIEEDIEKLITEVKPGLRYPTRGWGSTRPPIGIGEGCWRESGIGTVTFIDEFSWCRTRDFRVGGCGWKCQTSPSLSLPTSSWCPCLESEAEPMYIGLPVMEGGFGVASGEYRAQALYKSLKYTNLHTIPCCDE